MSTWTQKQRDKACTYLAKVLDVKKSSLSDHNLDAVINLACQRNELLETLKSVAKHLPGRSTVDALTSDSGLGYRRYPLSPGLLDTDVVRILDAIEKSEP